SRKKIKFSDLIKSGSKKEIIANFLAVLELIKLKEIVIKQKSIEDEILIEKKENSQEILIEESNIDKEYEKIERKANRRFEKKQNSQKKIIEERNNDKKYEKIERKANRRLEKKQKKIADNDVI